TDEDRVRLATELGGELRALGDRALRVLVDRALVVERVDKDVRHSDQFLSRAQMSLRSSSQATIFSTVSLVSSSSMMRPAALAGGALAAVHCAAELSPPTFEASMPTSPVVTASSGFFFAPMIAFSDG